MDECIINIEGPDSDISAPMDFDATPLDTYSMSSSSPYSTMSELYSPHSPFDTLAEAPPRPSTRRSSESASSFQQPEFTRDSASILSAPDFASATPSYTPAHSPYMEGLGLRVDTKIEATSPFLSSLGSSFGSPHDESVFLSPYGDPHSPLSPLTPFSSSSMESLLMTPEDATHGRGRAMKRDDSLLSPLAHSRNSSVASITRLAQPFNEDYSPSSPSGSIFEDFHAMLLQSPGNQPKPLDPGGCLDPRVELGGSDSCSDFAPSPSASNRPEQASIRRSVASEAVKKASAERRKHRASYKCDRCNATFTAKHNLLNHTNSHDNIKPFECKHCTAAFGTSGVLARHVKKRHEGVADSNGSPGARVTPRRIARRGH